MSDDDWRASEEYGVVERGAARLDEQTRSTLRRGAMGVALIVALTLGIGVCTVLLVTPRDPVGARLASVRELQAEGVLALTSEKIYLVDDGEIIALSTRSPHLGEPMAFCGPAQVFYSPVHGEKFDRRGVYLAGPAPGDMTTFPVTVVGDDVFVDLSRPTPGLLRDARGRRQSLQPSGPLCDEMPRH